MIILVLDNGLSLVSPASQLGDFYRFPQTEPNDAGLLLLRATSRIGDFKKSNRHFFSPTSQIGDFTGCLYDFYDFLLRVENAQFHSHLENNQAFTKRYRNYYTAVRLLCVHYMHYSKTSPHKETAFIYRQLSISQSRSLSQTRYLKANFLVPDNISLKVKKNGNRSKLGLYIYF